MAHRYRFFGTLQARDFDRLALKDSSEGLASDLPMARWELDEAESHHAVKTLRLSNHSIVEVTNGLGLWSLGQLDISGKKNCYVNAQDFIGHSIPGQKFIENNLYHESIGGGVHREIKGAGTVHIMVGALRSGEVDEILPTLTELGVSSISVFAQKDTPAWSQKTSIKERWDRILRQGIKQSKRSYLPDLFIERSIEEAIRSRQEKLNNESSLVKCVLSEGAKNSLLEMISSEIFGKHVLLVCGSERGLHDEEMLSLRHEGFQEVGLGNSILRAKTAVCLGAGVLTLYLDQAGPYGDDGKFNFRY